MRKLVAGAAVILAAMTSCDPVPAGPGRTVWVALNPHNRTISANSPTTLEYQWPYRTVATTVVGAPDEWTVALAFERSGKSEVRIRCFDGSGGGVRVEVTFAGPPNEHLSSITFQHITKIGKVGIQGGGAYEEWSKKGENFVLKAPSAPATVTFTAWPHVH